MARRLHTAIGHMLPIAANPSAAPAGSAPALPAAPLDKAGDVEALARDFALFTAAAGALESAYGKLQSEVVLLRRQLETAREELVREQDAARHWRALAQVARLLAQELRNPLASMELQAGLLLTSKSLEIADRQSASRLQAGVRYLTATLNNIVYFHEPAVAQAATPLAPLVRQACDFLAPLAEQARVRLRFTDRLTGARIAADPYRLQQVLLNLAQNAIRAMAEGGRLRVTGWRADESRVCLSFLDNGPGVPAELRERLFVPGVSSRPDGLGLGLAVAKSILEQHGGQIRLLPTRRGAGFLITLPSL